ncbi:DUF7218 family protein [Arthrobacter sp. TMN-49]
MPTKQNPGLKAPEEYQALRDDGASEQKAARISNAAAKRGRSAVGRKGGTSKDYEDWTVPELKEKAKEIVLSGYSRKRKDELIQPPPVRSRHLRSIRRMT